jgi:hypothetical protein
VPQLLLLAVNNQTSAPLWLFFAFPLLAGILLICQQLLFHYVYDVELRAAAVEIVVFKRLVILSIPYGDIVRVERVSFMQAIFSFALGLVNRPFGQYFLVHRTRGLFRRILVTPSGSDEFYNTLMMRLSYLPTETHPSVK